MSWVWIEGGLVQDQSGDVLVIDTDSSDFPDQDELREAQHVLHRARQERLPEYVIDAARQRVQHAEQMLGD